MTTETLYTLELEIAKLFLTLSSINPFDPQHDQVVRQIAEKQKQRNRHDSNQKHSVVSKGTAQKGR